MSTPQTLHGFLEQSAELFGDRPAVVDGEWTLTYAEFNERANQLAHALIQQGVAPGDRVGLVLDKSMHAIVGLYGILKTGAAYVSIDSKAPVARSGYIVGNCGIKVLLSETKQAGNWDELAHQTDLAHVVCMDGEPEEMPNKVTWSHFTGSGGNDAPVDIEVSGDDLAYIIYTSGSTGDPKGVKLTHRNGLAFVEWGVNEFSVTHEDRLSSHAPLHFDLSIWDVYAASMAGAALHIVPAMASVFPGQIVKFIDKRSITVWYSVPSILSMMVQRGNLQADSFPSLRILLFAGEVFPTKYLVPLMEAVPGAAFWNLYGPTETNVCTAYHVANIPDPEKGDIPIGHPVSSDYSYVVDEGGQVVADGDVGELWIGGDTIMDGYWADDEKTAARLVADPFDASLGMIYKTGDLVRVDDAGEFAFLGRRDNQIKSRGYRIELGEVETAMYGHPAVSECAVVAVPDDLVTNIVHAFVSVKDETTSQDLLKHVKAKVPHYMIPEHIDILEVLPKTSTGKIDRQTLTKKAIGER